MSTSKTSSAINKITFAGLIVTLGIVYGDIGTSPLYVIKAILSGAQEVNELLIYGAISCVFWTLTLQTSIKYVTITLRADNHGEGGIFALFALIKKKSTPLSILTMIGGSALLADGIITPAITVTSAVEGLHLINNTIPVIPVVLAILSTLFFIQQFGSNFIGKSFGPVMFLWFFVLGALGINQIVTHPQVLYALNPKYAIELLALYPGGILLLGAVFLATTGAEALYSDLGHCGIKNIRITWIFVKISLLLNYFGQGAWVLNHVDIAKNVNPFFASMPPWFILPGIILATAAAVIASQALISGSYTLISEAVTLNFWPKIKISYPTVVKGQVYIPFVNWFLWIACSVAVLFFKKSENMEAAYGLSISLTMIMTTLLLNSFLKSVKLNRILHVLIIAIFLVIETMFLFANLHKFMNGGWFSIVLALLFFIIMYGWFFGRRIKNRYISFVNLNKYTEMFVALSKDVSIPKISSNLVYITKANRLKQIEAKIIYSIFNKQPKRADTYWFLHIDSLDTPDTFEYQVHHVIPGILIKIDFRLGFKVERRINLYFHQVLEDLVKSGEINLISPYDSLKKHEIPTDFLFVNLARVLTNDYKLPPHENFVMSIHNSIRGMSITDVKALNLDTSAVIEEKVPIMIEQKTKGRIARFSE
ncbi:MAG: KUP/HAK/KT family potassium transporter [Bacteroidales bacterium]|nr:KUP/HAK/KT family potassium transporter [Bacteroidales bacterium]